MPIEFLQESQPTGSSDNSLFRLTMAYDGSGRRISKTRWVKKLGSQEWEKELVTHYTGIGTEVRENYAGPAKQTKVVVNMPEGLGRYGIEDAEKPDFGGRTGDQLAGYIPNVKFEWYLKNHLGSTMLVYGTEGNATSDPFRVSAPLAAYDYRAFGEQVNLVSSNNGVDKVTENFTGKEHDDEIALDYFGARYLDPMLGMWISVDPKRQFSSPYLYAGNGVNPVNGVDNTGNYMVRQRGGSYEIKTVSTLDASVGKAVIDGASVALAIGALVAGEEVGTALAISSAISGPLKGVAQGSAGETTIGAIESGASVVTGLESSMASGVVGVLFSLFDIARSSDNIVENVDSKDCIDSFNSRMISNGGSDYNSFKTEQAAKDFMNSIPECRIDDNQ